ncbi:MAG: ExbD/TolR family protein [bacterium]
MEEGTSINKINLTSLVDVSLTLVIIFMVAAPFVMQTGIKVTSSKMGAAEGKVAQSENVNIYLSADGKIKVNGQPVSWEQLAAALKVAIPKSKDRMVILLASPKNNVKQIVDILDCARQQGAVKLAILKER